MDNDTLPEWMEKLKIGYNAGMAYEALRIAWEALTNIACGCDNPDCKDAKDPIRRYCKACRTKWHREYYHRKRKEL